MLTGTLLNQANFALNVSMLINYIFREGYATTLGEAYRPQFVQDKYYEEGKTHTLTSQHTKRLAIDLNLFIDGTYISGDNPVWHDLGTYWKSLNPAHRWGGDFESLKDYNHFEALYTQIGHVVTNIKSTCCS
jgi:hypothetical protein